MVFWSNTYLPNHINVSRLGKLVIVLETAAKLGVPRWKQILFHHLGLETVHLRLWSHLESKRSLDWSSGCVLSGFKVGQILYGYHQVFKQKMSENCCGLFWQIVLAKRLQIMIQHRGLCLAPYTCDPAKNFRNRHELLLGLTVLGMQQDHRLQVTGDQPRQLVCHRGSISWQDIDIKRGWYPIASEHREIERKQKSLEVLGKYL